MGELNSKDQQNDRRVQVKLGMKIWYAIGKFVKSQCNKDKVVDTLFFGTFCRAGVLTRSDKSSNYVYCPGPKAIFKLNENRENVADISESVLNEKLTTLSVASVAQVCNTTSEIVSGILSGIRDEIVEMIKFKKVNLISLNFPIGVLTLNKAG